MTSEKKILAIVGAGATGVATFIAAVMRRAASVIYVVDPRSIGPGIAFGNSDEEVLCNTSVDIMSVVADKPADFLDYLNLRGYVATLDSYVPRRLMGQYLADRFIQYREIAKVEGIEVIHLAYRFRSLSVDKHRRYTIRFADTAAQPVTVTDVVFCTGHGSPRVPDLLKIHRHQASFIGCPYPETELLARVPTKSRVLIVGSKQSAVDAAILLGRDGHHVTMLSPSGEIPSVRARFIRSESLTFDKESLQSIMARWDPRNPGVNVTVLKRACLRLAAKTLSTYSGKRWRKQFSYSTHRVERLREEISIVEADGCVWQDLSVRLIDAVNEFYEDEGRKIHPDFKRLIYRYITAMALPNAKKILRSIDSGALSIAQGTLGEVVAPGDGRAQWAVSWGEGVQHFDAIVVAAGFHLPNFVFSKSGELGVDAEGSDPQAAVEISEEMRIGRSTGWKDESLWFVGASAHARLPIPNSVFIVAPIADRVVAKIAQGGLARRSVSDEREQ